MPQGLRLNITGDASQAITAIKSVVAETKVAGKQVDKSFGKTTLPLTKGITETSNAVKKLTPQISTLGNSIETLRAKALARKSFLITETDITKVKLYNREIKLLEAEIARLQAVGTSSLGAIGAAGTKAFSALRTAAHILPGIGIAGIFGGLFTLVSNLGGKADETAEKLKELIKPISALREAATAGAEDELSKVTALSNAVLNQTLSYKDRNAALNQLKEINKGYFGDLTVETAALGLLKTRVDEYSNALINQAVIKAFSDNIGKIAVELSEQEKQFNKLNKAVDQSREKLAASAGDDFFFQNIKVQDATRRYEKQAKVVGTLRNQMFELRTAIQEAVNTSLTFKPLDEKTVKENVEKVKKLFQRNFGSEAELIIAPKLTLDFSSGAAFTNFAKQIEVVSDVLQREVERLTKNNPILKLRAQIDIDAANAIAKIQKNAEATAALINGVLTPAFNNLFNAIQAGENPLKAFFKGIGQAVLQLIQKLIQAAITAAILSALIPGGGGGFAKIFGKMFGFSGGGLVSGPTLGMIGEGSGTSLSNPEVIAPLDQLKSMLSDLNVGNQRVQVAVTGRLRGRDMALQNARTSRTNRRLGA